MAESILGAWWERLRGRLRPRPCPYSLAGALEVPGRRLVAGPERVLDAFGIRAGNAVLEIGPGTGFYSVAAGRRVGAHGRLICLDLQPEMLQHTRRRIEAGGLRADLVQADACALPLRSSSLDHVFLITVLGEIPDRPAALAEIGRVLRAGGHLSVAEQFPDPDFVTRGTLRRELAAAGFAEKKTSGWLFYTSTWSRAPRSASSSVGCRGLPGPAGQPAARRAAAGEGVMARDPVCGMTVGEEHAAHTVTYQGKPYWFCSEGCRAEFLRYPDDYAASEPESGDTDV